MSCYTCAAFQITVHIGLTKFTFLADYLAVRMMGKPVHDLIAARLSQRSNIN